MRIFDLFYLTLVSCLLSLTIPESQGRWSALYRNVLSLISYARLTCSTLSRPNYFAIVTNSPSSDDSFCLIGEAGVCRQAAFGIDDTCHPLDAPTTPTPTLVLNVSATRTVTAIAASPIAFNPILYKDTFATQFDAKNVLRKSKRPKSVLGHILSEKHSVHLPDFLSAAISTIIVVRMLTVIGQPVVGYFEPPNLTTPIPNSLEFRPPTAFLDHPHSLVLSWISTASSLIPISSVPCAFSDDEISIEELPQWLLYFATILVRPCSEPTTVLPSPLTCKTRVTQRRPPMIESSTTHKAEEVLSFCWFQPHAHLASSSALGEDHGVELADLKDRVGRRPPTLKLKPAVQSQAPDVVHPPALPTANSLHLVDYIDESAESSHPDPSLGMSGATPARPFERISGRRTTLPIQPECGRVSDTGGTPSRLSPLEATSVESLPLGGYDFGLLSEFPAPPKKVPVRPLSLLKKAGMRKPFPKPTILPASGSRLAPRHALPVRLAVDEPSNPSSKDPRSIVHLADPIHRAKPGPSAHRIPTFQTLSSTSMIIDHGEPSRNLSPRSDPVSSDTSRWGFLTKKSRQRQTARNVSSSPFASSNSSITLHEKVSVLPKSLSRQTLGSSQRPELLGSFFFENGDASTLQVNDPSTPQFPDRRHDH